MNLKTINITNMSDYSSFRTKESVAFFHMLSAFPNFF